jgi:mRNA-degrading endonuclease RelE of RelBE toxin-antitoxin system
MEPEAQLKGYMNAKFVRKPEENTEGRGLYKYKRRGLTGFIRLRIGTSFENGNEPEVP